MRWNRSLIGVLAVIGVACTSDVSQKDQQGWHVYGGGMNSLLDSAQAIDSADAFMATRSCTNVRTNRPPIGTLVLSVPSVGRQYYYCGDISRDSAHMLTRAFNEHASSWTSGAHTMTGYWDVSIVATYECESHETGWVSSEMWGGKYTEVWVHTDNGDVYVGDYQLDAGHKYKVSYKTCQWINELDATYYTSDDQPAAPPGNNGPGGTGWGNPPAAPPAPPTRHVSSLTISPSAAFIDSGQVSPSFTVSGTYSDGTPFTVTDTFSIANPSIVHNDDLGAVLGVGVGSTTISITVGTITATATVNVVNTVPDEALPDTGLRNCADTASISFSGDNRGFYFYCRGARVQGSDSAHVAAAINAIKNRGGACADIGNLADSIFKAGRVHVLGGPSITATATSSPYAGSTGFIGIHPDMLGKWRLSGGASVGHVTHALYPITLQSIIVHETEHAQNGDTAHINQYEAARTTHEIGCSDLPPSSPSDPT